MATSIADASASRLSPYLRTRQLLSLEFFALQTQLFEQLAVVLGQMIATNLARAQLNIDVIKFLNSATVCPIRAARHAHLLQFFHVLLHMSVGVLRLFELRFDRIDSKGTIDVRSMH